MRKPLFWYIWSFVFLLLVMVYFCVHCFPPGLGNAERKVLDLDFGDPIAAQRSCSWCKSLLSGIASVWPENKEEHVRRMLSGDERKTRSDGVGKREIRRRQSIIHCPGACRQSDFLQHFNVPATTCANDNHSAGIVYLWNINASWVCTTVAKRIAESQHCVWMRLPPFHFWHDLITETFSTYSKIVFWHLTHHFFMISLIKSVGLLSETSKQIKGKTILKSLNAGQGSLHPPHPLITPLILQKSLKEKDFL